MKYHHSFHAGNFADVHKHITLIALLQALLKKDKGLLFLDTHAGAGRYELRETGRAERVSEWQDGIGRLWSAEPQAPEIASYLQYVRSLQPRRRELSVYPGSPLLAARLLRAQDRVHCVDSEREVVSALRRTLHGSVRITAQCGDGFHAVKALLPPIERRGLVLIDPPYEESSDDAHALGALSEGLQRFATGVFAVWRPVKLSADTERWTRALAPQIEQPALVAQLWLHPRDTRVGLAGSCIAVVNPPYQIAERMRAWLPELLQLLGSPPGSGWDVREIAAR
jgi:23S rRNA (adenine2030-N6)-methyltransferase